MTSRNSFAMMFRDVFSFLGDHEYSRGAAPQDHLQLRSPRHAVSTDCEAAARSPQPDSGDQLLAPHLSRGSLHQLAAGSAWEFSCSRGLSGSNAAVLA